MNITAEKNKETTKTSKITKEVKNTLGLNGINAKKGDSRKKRQYNWKNQTKKYW